MAWQRHPGWRREEVSHLLGDTAGGKWEIVTNRSVRVREGQHQVRFCVVSRKQPSSLQAYPRRHQQGQRESDFACTDREDRLHPERGLHCRQRAAHPQPQDEEGRDPKEIRGHHRQDLQRDQAVIVKNQHIPLIANTIQIQLSSLCIFH